MLTSLYLMLVYLVRTPPGESLIHTLDISYSPGTARTIHADEVQVFRVPLCGGRYTQGWVYQVDVYLTSVRWDSNERGDDNWLRIRVGNSRHFNKVVCDNTIHKEQTDPPSLCGPFRYDRDRWGPDDLYIEITAGSGTPTYLYGLQVKSQQGDTALDAEYIPDAMEQAIHHSGGIPHHDVREIETLEQIAIPYNDRLESGKTRQFSVMYCFEEGDRYPVRIVTVTALVRRVGGVSTYVCTSPMLDEAGLCYRSVVTDPSLPSSPHRYDASGSKTSTVTTEILKSEFGPINVVVLAQGGFEQHVDYSIVTKLKNPEVDMKRIQAIRNYDNVLAQVRRSSDEL